MPRAMARVKDPLSYSSAIAVVMVRVNPLVLPPSIMLIPTSEITLPKAAMTADTMPNRASLKMTQAVWARFCAQSHGGFAVALINPTDGRNRKCSHYRNN